MIHFHLCFYAIPKPMTQKLDEYFVLCSHPKNNVEPQKERYYLMNSSPCIFVWMTMEKQRIFKLSHGFSIYKKLLLTRVVNVWLPLDSPKFAGHTMCCGRLYTLIPLPSTKLLPYDDSRERGSKEHYLIHKSLLVHNYLLIVHFLHGTCPLIGIIIS